MQATTQATHTAGPWHRNIKAGGKYPAVFAGRNQHVAVVTQQKTADETEANIDLIAAAPDGYALIEKILAADASQFSGPAQFQAWCALIAKPYLARATGGVTP